MLVEPRRAAAAQRADRRARERHAVGLDDRLEAELLGQRVGLGDVVDRARPGRWPRAAPRPSGRRAGCGTRPPARRRASAMFATRAVLVAKRSSAGSSGSPTASHSRANRRSLPAATANGRSAAVVGLVRRDARVAVAAARRQRARRHPARALVEQRGRARSRAARPRRGGPRRCARARAAPPRCPPPRAGPQTRSTTAAPTFSGAPVGLAGDAHQPAHRLQQQVVAGQPGRALGRAEGGDRARDQPRVALAQRVAVEPPAGHQPGPEGLDQHVGARARARAPARGRPRRRGRARPSACCG